MSTSRARAGIWSVAVVVAALACAGCEVRAGEGDLSFDCGTAGPRTPGRGPTPWLPAGASKCINVNGRDSRRSRPTGRSRARRARGQGRLRRGARRTCCARSRCARRSAPDRVRIETRAPRGRLRRAQDQLDRQGASRRARRLAHRERRRPTRHVGGRSAGHVHQRRHQRHGLPTCRCSTRGHQRRRRDRAVRRGGPGRSRQSRQRQRRRAAWRCPRARRPTCTARCTNGRVSVTDFDLAVEGEQTRRRADGAAERRRRAHRPGDHQRRRQRIRPLVDDPRAVSAADPRCRPARRLRLAPCGDCVLCGPF